MASQKIPRTCEQCGTFFLRQRCRAWRGEGKYCSVDCRRASRRINPSNRFWDKVQKTKTCWLWIASCNPAGYGTINAGSEQLAHRISYVIAYGEIPDDLCVLHRCDVRNCVRPDHLFTGTQIDNIRDMVAKGRHRNGSTK